MRALDTLLRSYSASTPHERGRGRGAGGGGMCTHAVIPGLVGDYANPTCNHRHPRGGGDPYAQTSAISSRGLPVWVPACAGMTVTCLKGTIADVFRGPLFRELTAFEFAGRWMPERVRHDREGGSALNRALAVVAPPVRDYPPPNSGRYPAWNTPQAMRPPLLPDGSVIRSSGPRAPRRPSRPRPSAPPSSRPEW